VDPRSEEKAMPRYLREVPVTRPYFAVTADSPDEDVTADAHRHPVFRLTSGETR